MNLGMFEEWAQAHGVPLAARNDWYRRVGILTAAVSASEGRSESNVSSRVRMTAGERGYSWWRNNVGASKTESGSYVRYGLANDSERVNRVLKSGDLIACVPRLITPAHIGTVIGQFASAEVKHEGWQYSGTEREVAQLNWINLVTARGGWAAFVTSPEQIP